MGEERSFKKSALGGFNRKDVIAYIEELMNLIEMLRAENKRKDARIEDLERKLAVYEEACSVSSDISAGEELSSADVLAEIDEILIRYLGREE
ncbi:MAG: DivIVA domain-containing protein [Clostridia bacterium]|nr:DivIVA domain-containing protein [Clostridia bacterium]